MQPAGRCFTESAFLPGPLPWVLLISRLAGASDRWLLSESASGVGKSAPDEAGFLVSQLRKTVFQKTEVPLRLSQT